MRTRTAPAVLLAACGASCSQVEPLPDCAEQSGLYLPYHVCMPVAGEPIAMPVAPRKLVAGDFDDEKIDNDFAVLLDQEAVHVYTTVGLRTQLAAELKAPARVESLVAARYFDLGQAGDDLIGTLRGDGIVAGKLFGIHNGGDVFAGQVLEELNGLAYVHPLTVKNCVAPNSLVAVEVPEFPLAVGLAFACETAGGAATKGEIDGVLVYNPVTYDEADPIKPFNDHWRVGAVVPELAEVHAATVAQLDGLGPPDVAFASRTGEGEDESLVVMPVSSEPMMNSVPELAGIIIPLTNGRVGALQVADLDDDGDSDLVAVHPQAGGITVVRQSRSEPLELAEPAFFPVGSEIRDVVIGEFTGDGGVDIAVAQVVDDTGYNAISMFVRKPDLVAGTVDFALAPVAYLKGEILDLEPLDYDGDGRVDVAAVVKVGSAGQVYVFLNRSPAGG